MSELDPAISERIREAGASIQRVQATPGSAEDAQITSALASSIGAGWVIVDGPAFDDEWESALQRDFRLMRIDDNGIARPFRADILLNQNIGAEQSDYPKRSSDCELLLGTGYTLLRSEFSNLDPITRGDRIVVTMGGTDPARATERVIDALLQPPASGLAADILVGAANPRRNDLEIAVESARPRLQVFVGAKNIRAIFSGAAFAVTAGGTTVYELARLGTPMILMSIADNQRRTCANLAAIGAAEYLGWHDELSVENLAGRLAGFASAHDIRGRLAARAAKLVDGHGVQRVLAALRVFSP
jgi:spore coat polysaccharide biosynthesis predicted glycosyltransferase SpsG